MKNQCFYSQFQGINSQLEAEGLSMQTNTGMNTGPLDSSCL